LVVEKVVHMTIEPIKDVGALSEDRGGMRVRLPRGRTRPVGEVEAEEGDCSPEGASTRVSCLKENVMEDVWNVKCFGGFNDPRKEAVVECTQIVLFD
jgi:hypothetical protein